MKQSTARRTPKSLNTKAINNSGVYMNRVKAFISPKKLRNSLSASAIIVMIAALLCFNLTGLAATLISPTGDGGFETGADFPTNGWTVVNGANNRLFVGSTPVPSAGTNAAFSGTSAASWTGQASASVNHFYRNVTFPAGETIITLSFKYKVSVADLTFDYLKVFLVPTTTTPVAGTQLSSGQIGVTAGYDSATSYTTVNITIPASAANTTQRLVFSWRTDAASPLAAVAVDEISLVTAAPVPLTGIKTIDNTIATGGNNYNSFGAAISALNTNGVGAGGVTFNVTAGQTFTEYPPIITTTGTAANPIIFQKSGVGANPIAQGTGGVGTIDSFFDIPGGDYFTFDGIDIKDNPANANNTTRMEYGFLVRNASATNGATNNTFKNSTITLQRVNTTSIGILQTTNTLGGGVAATSTGGANSDNKYYNITIQNAYSGVYLLGTAGFPDANTEVGVTGGVTANVIGNPATPNDIGNGTADTWGIRAASQNSLKIFNNNIQNVTGTGANNYYGIWLDNSAGGTFGTAQIYNNKISSISRITSTSVNSLVYGILTNVSTGNTATVFNNFITGLSATNTASTANLIIRGLAANAGGNAGTVNAYFNSVRVDQGANLLYSSTAYYLNGGSTTTRNNIFSNFTGTQTVTPKHYAYYRAAGTITASSNNDLYIASGTGVLTNGYTGFFAGAVPTDRDTLASWATASGETNSTDLNPLFVSATDLHITVSSPAIDAGLAVAGINDDIDAQVRPNGVVPDIGADEFYVTPGAGVLQFNPTAYNVLESNSVVVTVERTSGNTGTVMVNYATSNGTGAAGGASCTAGVDYVTNGGTLTFGPGITSQTITVQTCPDTAIDDGETIILTLTSPTGGATIGANNTATITIQDTANQFRNSGNIAITEPGTAPNAATPYPSTITVSGMGIISSARVTLYNLSHSFPDDLDILLVGPGGQKFIILSDAGGGTDAVDVTLTLDDTAAGTVPNSFAPTALTSGTFDPTDYSPETGTETFPAPVPAGTNLSPAPTSTNTFTSVFGGTNPNGVWSLYVVDDETGDVGNIAGGWGLQLFAPTSAEANVGGRILTNNGQPLSGVQINLLDTQLGQVRTSMTDANGDYQFGSVLTGRDILVTPVRQGYTFSPQNQVFSHTGERLNVNFIATADTSQGRAVFNDFDGDGKSDLAVFRPSDATWYIMQSSNGVMQAVQWGLGSDRIVPADYDGDRKTDVAVFRPSTGAWHIYQSATQTVRSVQWGIEEDIVMPADFDGDGKADLTVFRPSTGAWYILESQTGQMRAFNWGASGDRPVAADYDNDGKADIAVFRPSTGTWYIVNSSNNSQRAENWGLSTDRPVTGDFDGDHRADLAVFRPENGFWYVLLSSDGSISAKAHGTGADRPVPADFDGDGKTDRAVWQQADGNWLILRSSTNASSGQLWGTNGDVPAPSAYVP